MATTEAPAVIVETIDIQAPIGAVYTALTEPDQLVQWWGSDDSYHCEAMESDLRVGGAWKTTGMSKDGKPFSVGGVYRVIDPPNVVEFTWLHNWADGREGAETIVRYELREANGTTELRVIHSGFVDPTERENHVQGWKRVLGWLRDYATR